MDVVLGRLGEAVKSVLTGGTLKAVRGYDGIREMQLVELFESSTLGKDMSVIGI